MAITTTPLRFSRTCNFLRLCLVLAFYYNAYRYPLQLSSSQTSPTYSDTPIIIQLGKYGIFLCICSWFISRMHRFRLPERDLVVFVATTCFACLSLLLAVTASLRATEPLASIRTAQDSLFLAIPLLSMGFGIRCSVDKIARPIWVFLLLSLIVLALQVVLFKTNGRLPALAYEDSLSVRFGSIWDDPNAFPMMLALFVPLVLFRFTSIAVAVITIFSAVVIIVMAQSLTCAASLAVCFVAAAILRFSDRMPVSGLAIKACIIMLLISLAIAIVDIEPLKSVFVRWQQEKATSIRAHVTDLDRFDALAFLGLTPSGIKGESGWLNLLLNQGIVLTALYCLFIITGIVQAAAAALRCSVQEKGVLYGAFCFQVAFAVSLFALPNNLVFPLNMINYILWSVVYMWRRAARADLRVIESMASPDRRALAGC